METIGRRGRNCLRRPTALVTAMGALVARAFWAASGLAFLPYVLFWVWLIATSLLLMRRASQNAAA